jgi:hypothetical protein
MHYPAFAWDNTLIDKGRAGPPFAKGGRKVWGNLHGQPANLRLE